jgi:DNA-binding SARP family transcriptional activator/TolB-like protein
LQPIVFDPAERSGQHALSTLKVTLFGHMRAEDAAGRSVLPRGRKTRALLAMLALSPHGMVARARAAALLWSLRNKEQAHTSLRQAVHELQQALRPVDPPLLRADRHHLVLAVAAVSSDATGLMHAAQSGPDVLGVFARPLLEDLRDLDPAFDRWIEEQSATLRQAGRAIGDALLAAQTDPAATLHIAAQVLRIDEAHEMAWHAAIGAHLAQGDRAAALAAYQRCCAALGRKGDCAPSSEIERLVVQVPRPVPGLPDYRAHEVRAGPTGRNGHAEGLVRLGVFPLRWIEPSADDGLGIALAEEIVTALAQFRWMTCIVHVASLAADAPPVFLQTVLKLDFLLDGTIQRSGSRIRVIVQLSDTRAGGTVVWARRFDREVADIFCLQDEIAAETAAQLDTALLIWEGERARAGPLADPDAIGLMLGAIPSIYRLESARFRKAGEQLETALSLDPANAAAHAWLAYWHLFLVGQGWAPDSNAAIGRAAELAERAVGLDARDARAVTLAGHVRGFLGKRPDEARSLHDRALALNPNLPLAWCFSGLAHSYLGDHAEAIRRIDHAQRLAPHDPHAFFFDTARIMPHLLRREFAAAVSVGRQAIALNPGFSSAYKGVLSALGHLGRTEDAAALRERLLELEPGFSVQDATIRSPMVQKDDLALYADGLRRAGLPEG